MLVFPEASFVANKNNNDTNNSNTINSNSNFKDIKSNNSNHNKYINSNNNDGGDTRARMETLDMLMECTGSVWSWPGPWISGQ